MSSWCCSFKLPDMDSLLGFVTARRRLLPGHPARIDQFAWDVRNGYLGCLCQNGCLLVWDLLSGALERMLHGAAARLLFHQLERNTPRPGGVARRAMRIHCPSPALAVLSVDVPLLLSPKGDSLQEATRSSHRNHKPSPAPPAYSVPAPYSGAGKVTPEEARALWLVLECFHPWGLDPAMDRLVYWMGEQGGEASLQGAGPIATQGNCVPTKHSEYPVPSVLVGRAATFILSSIWARVPVGRFLASAGDISLKLMLAWRSLS